MIHAARDCVIEIRLGVKVYTDESLLTQNRLWSRTLILSIQDECWTEMVGILRSDVCPRLLSGLTLSVTPEICPWIGNGHGESHNPCGH